MQPRERLAVALDVPTAAEALALSSRLSPHVGCFKIGLELFIAEGPPLVRQIAADAPVFLDLKLHDIPATVERAARSAAALGATYLTIHWQQPEAITAAAEAAPELKILVVTVLTSVAADEGTEQRVVERARVARSAGAAGVVCSGREAAAVRRAVGDRFLIVTPGVRPAGAAAGDQQRVVTPRTP